MSTNNARTYSDVLIEPKYSEIESRTSINLSTAVGHLDLKLPVISANMKTITGPAMAREMALNGGMGILHRFNTVEQSCENLRQTQEGWSAIKVGVSIGVKEEDKQRFESLAQAGATTFCIDVAHGHHILVKKMLHWINSQFFQWDRANRGNITLMAGNIATANAYHDLRDWGADAVKVGIGPGNVCLTRRNTGVGVPQLHALECVHSASTSDSTPISIIADGGISSVGDVAKALKYADAVMIGSMLSGTTETPGKVFRGEDGSFYKTYGGSASGENKGSNQFVEGMMKTVKFHGKSKYILREIEHGLKSAFSYVGANNLKEFQQKCEFIDISSGAQKESKL